MNTMLIESETFSVSRYKPNNENAPLKRLMIKISPLQGMTLNAKKPIVPIVAA